MEKKNWIGDLLFLFGPECVLLFGFILMFILHIVSTIAFKFDFKINQIFVILVLFILFLYTYLGVLQIWFFKAFTYNFVFNSFFQFETHIFWMKAMLGYLTFCIVSACLMKEVDSNHRRMDLKMFEFSSLVLLMLFGMSVCLIANNLIIFYLALELQSFCIFILLFLNARAPSEIYASIAYFISVLVSSIFFLVGVVYLYDKFGSLNLNELWISVYTMTQYEDSFTNFDIAIMFVFVLGLFVKVGLFPVHMWVPQVYGFGNLIPVSIIATISKLFGFGILIHILFVFSTQFILFKIIIFVSICAIIQGVLSALTQSSLFLLLGYSAIAHIGYIFLIVGMNTTEAYAYGLFYLIIYLFNLIPVFLFCLTIYSSSGDLNKKFYLISDFHNIRFKNTSDVVYFLIFSTFFFSFVGIPPFSGFFAKFYIIVYLFYANSFFLAFIVGFFSVVSAFYYLKIVQSIFFDSEIKNNDESMDYWVLPTSTKFFILVFGFFNICFVFIHPFLLNILITLF